MSSSLNLDSYLESIRAESPPYDCPLEDCEKSFRKINLLQTHLHSEHPLGDSDKLKSRLRKTNNPQHEEVELSKNPLERVVYFKYNDVKETLPVTSMIRITTRNTAQSEISCSLDQRSKKLKTKKGLMQTNNRYVTLRVPEPKYEVVAGKANEPYREPAYTSSAYYRFKEELNDEDIENTVEYDMDDEDYIWLDLQNERRRKDRLLDVEKNVFEYYMDRFEKESFFQGKHTGNDPSQIIDEDAVCCICNDGECHNSNAILFCDMCNLAVHQECYGVPYIPEGQWLCRRCMQSPSRAVDCVLCPNTSGAFKQTDDNRWAHVICALWIPEVCFANTVFLEPVDSIKSIPAARWKLLCSICHKKGVGACIQCHKSNCYVAFHVTCAQHAGLYMKIEAVEEPGPTGSFNYVRKAAFCEQHAPEKSNSSNGVEGSGEEDSKQESKSSKTKTKSKSKARRNTNEKRNIPRPVVSIPTISFDSLAKIAAHNTISFPRRNDFLVHLYAYWRLKRQSRNGAPLLRRLQNSNSILRIDLNKDRFKKETARFQKVYKKLVQIRHHLERGRMLLESSKKRERSKITLLKHTKDIYSLMLPSFKEFLLYILEKISQKDVDNFFQEPVTEEVAPYYFTYVENPMDLGTMRQKVLDHKYSTFDDFVNDLYLICDNCTLYNQEDTIFYKCALKFRTQIDKILDSYRPYLADYDQKAGMLLETIESEGRI